MMAASAPGPRVFPLSLRAELAGAPGRVWAIALATTREALRNRVLAVLAAFAVGIVAFSFVLGEMSLHEEIRVTKDIGLASISLVNVVIALFLGVNLLSKELDKKTVYAILPKPLRRWEFIVGKYVGLCCTSGLLLVAMSLVLAGAIALRGGTHDLSLVRAEVLIGAELAVLAAVALLFSSFSTPYLSAMLTAGVWIIGRNSVELETLASAKFEGQAVGTLLHVIVVVVPDFSLFFPSGVVEGGEGGLVSIHETFLGWGYVAGAGGYALLVIAACLCAASVAFSRRDFT